MNFPTLFQEFIYTRTYSRWIDELNRRETWTETVLRYTDYLQKNLGDKLTTKELDSIYKAILSFEVMPSMRALWAAGGAADADNLAMYNCSFIAIEDLKNFSEILYILMNGTGVGFSVEKEFIDKLPVVAEDVSKSSPSLIMFEDSKIGWAEGFDKVLNCLWTGIPFECDYSKIRSRGARLKTMGGRASGPAPLKDLIRFVTDIAERNRGHKIQSIDVHDICCKIADIVVVGGVRRSACISFSDLDDRTMANAKKGEFWNSQPQRMLANNSATYLRKPNVSMFIEEWKHLYQSNSGERGIFNRMAAKKKAAENNRRDASQVVAGNPCMEILLRSAQLCNLSEVVVRPDDTFDTLKQKVKIATLIGTCQAAFTKFNYINKKWIDNCEEERLLGVSLTGLRDHPVLGSVNDEAKKWLADLKHVTIQTNKKAAAKLGINRATAITAIKPSGTVSLLVDSAPGAHTRQTKTGYYIRRVRISATDPLFKMMAEQGVPFQCEVGQSPESCNTYVLEFPCKAPEKAITRKNENAIEQLEYWKMLRTFWCEHNPSITVSVKEDEWLDTAAWVYKHFDDICGVSFLPSSDHVYQLAPYEDITKEQYDKLVKEMPVICFDRLSEYELEDATLGSKEYACTGGSCELV